MKPMKFEGYHKILAKPESWDTNRGHCMGLPCAISSGVVHSQWRFTWKERIKVLFGKPLTLAVVTGKMPPVSLEIRKVFND